MFKRKPKPESNLQTTIDELLAEMAQLEGDSEEYDKLLNQLERIYKLQTRENEKKKVSADVAVTVAANLLGILLILNHERLGVVTSKAVGFVMKSKI